MSVQFGRWRFDGVPAAAEYVAEVGEILSPYGPDGGNSYSSGGVKIFYYAVHTTKESRTETQPHVSPSGTVITWDGRLDNRIELIGSLNCTPSIDCTDVSIVAAAYERWGIDCFAKLIGDWALSIWSPNDHSLVLAKDPIGTRHLFYLAEKDRVTWSTILDPLVLFAGNSFRLDDEYLAGWLSHFPATHLTPYVGIHAVPPSSFVVIKEGKCSKGTYWDFDPNKKIRYRSDAEYEEHFRWAFAQSVRKRLRSDSPILAELSGGIDSSSIVCMADEIIGHGEGETPRLDTVSYYDDSEPNWNERPYFTKVEEKRGRSGCHIDVGLREGLDFQCETIRFAVRPGSGCRLGHAARVLASYIGANRNRVILSGIGGDEFMGGVPTPVPELANLLTGAHFKKLAHQLKVWALATRKPWFHLLFEAARPFFPPTLTGAPKFRRPAPWLHPDFSRRHRKALSGYERGWKMLGPEPYFQENLSTMEALRRQLACLALPSEPPYETRYPYLDRDLLEFIFAIPPEQLVRPGHRRSLMRRALAQIVPLAILNRKRKAFVARGPRVDITRQWDILTAGSQHLVSASYGIVDPGTYRQALDRARQGLDVPIVPLLRTLELESWLRALEGRNILEQRALETTSTQRVITRHRAGPATSRRSFDLS